jgi:PAS domain-containing serine/threonine kinase
VHLKVFFYSYTILFGEVPFATSEQAISAPYKPPRIRADPEALRLIDWMLEKDPKKRPTAEQVYMHPWIRERRVSAM